ncbi:MAG: pirin-like C-terminal cupin domain-containing protein, partial [Arenimonas sp.]
YEGAAVPEGEEVAMKGDLLVFGEGDAVRLTARGGSRFILVAGRPLGEPVARYGPFVMNTKEQVMQAFVDFQEGRF